MAEKIEDQKPQGQITAKEFFEKIPPGQLSQIKYMANKQQVDFGVRFPIKLPAIELHCTKATCDGIRFFDSEDVQYAKPNKREEHFVTYVCRNCKEEQKVYAFFSKLSKDSLDGELFKLGEYPSFGPPAPRRLLKLLEAEKDYFLKGRRTENQALGIAAFAYYRRVVEHQKNKIFEEIIRVSEKLGASPEMLQDFISAKNENQFSKAVDSVKHGIPQALLINGHNPLKLLHSALSEGLHAQTDEECLELATSIRIVLAELSERLANALKEEAELTAAVGRLLNPKGSTPKTAS